MRKRRGSFRKGGRKNYGRKSHMSKGRGKHLRSYTMARGGIRL